MAESAAAKKKRQAAAEKAKRQAELKAQFGYVDSFINSAEAKARARRGGKPVAGSSVYDIFQRAVKEEWSPTRFQTAIRNTPWWKQRDADQRDYDVTVYQDPAAKKARDQAAVDKVKQYASQMGVTLTAADLDPNIANSLVHQAARNNFSDIEYQHAVAKRYTAPTSGKATGAGATALDDLKKIADDYGIAVTDAKLQGDVAKILAGDAQSDQYRDQYRELAKAQYANIAPLLDKGMTVKDVIDPYLQVAKTELGINDAEFGYVDPNGTRTGTIDPKWTAALSPGENGAMMSTDEWRKRLRSDDQYGWKNTQGAKDIAQQFADQVGRTFGGLG